MIRHEASGPGLRRFAEPPAHRGFFRAEGVGELSRAVHSSLLVFEKSPSRTTLELSSMSNKGGCHMRRVFAVLGSVLFFALAPGTVAGLVPWWISRWRFENPAIWWLPLRVAGGVLVAAGTLVLLDSFARFAI